MVRLSRAPFQIDRRGVVFELAPIAVHIGSRTASASGMWLLHYRDKVIKRFPFRPPSGSKKMLLARCRVQQPNDGCASRCRGSIGKWFRMKVA